MKKYALGLDFGTNSCRSLIVDIEDGTELSSSVFPYHLGENGIFIDPNDPNIARQNPQDYLDGISVSVREAIHLAENKYYWDWCGYDREQSDACR